GPDRRLIWLRVLYPIISGSLHIYNARIWTGDAARPWAASMAIHHGRVARVAPTAAHRSSVQQAEITTINARGRVIAPGLIDSHMHLLTGGRSLLEVDLSRARSRGDFERAI